MVLADGEEYLCTVMHSIGGIHVTVLEADEGAVIEPSAYFVHYPVYANGYVKTSDEASTLIRCAGESLKLTASSCMKMK